MTLITRSVDPDITVIELAGKMTSVLEFNVEAIVAQLLADGARKVVFDLSELGYIDSSGIGQLISSASKIIKVGGKCCVSGTKGLVLKVFQIARVYTLIPFADTEAEACALLSA
jgi:anti-sigma B factor antagonist